MSNKLREMKVLIGNLVGLNKTGTYYFIDFFSQIVRIYSRVHIIFSKKFIGAYLSLN